MDWNKLIKNGSLVSKTKDKKMEIKQKEKKSTNTITEKRSKKIIIISYEDEDEYERKSKSRTKWEDDLIGAYDADAYEKERDLDLASEKILDELESEFAPLAEACIFLEA